MSAMDDEHETTTTAGGPAAPEDFAVVIDARGSVTMWSAGAGRLLGYEPEDMVGRPAARPPTCSPRSCPSPCGATWQPVSLGRVI